MYVVDTLKYSESVSVRGGGGDCTSVFLDL